MTLAWIGLEEQLGEVSTGVRALLSAAWPEDTAVAYAEAPAGAGPAALRRALGEQGWLGISVPAAAGGSGASFPHEAGFALGCAHGLAPAAISATVHTTLVAAASARERVREGLAGLLDGSRGAALALAEEGADYEVSSVRTTARAAAGAVVLDGEKRFVAGGMDADVYGVVARTRDGAIDVFLVDRDAVGLTVSPVVAFGGELQARLRLAGTPAVALGLDPAELAELFERLRLLVAMDLVGTAEAVIERTATHVKQRHQFSRPIGSFQAVQHLLAEGLMLTDAARLLTCEAVVQADHGTVDRAAASRAHIAAADAAHQATVFAHQLHGGMGYVRESPLHLWSERARRAAVALGNRAWHLRRLRDADTH